MNYTPQFIEMIVSHRKNCVYKKKNPVPQGATEERGGVEVSEVLPFCKTDQLLTRQEHANSRISTPRRWEESNLRLYQNMVVFCHTNSHIRQ